jgi:hypothetical protein
LSTFQIFPWREEERHKPTGLPVLRPTVEIELSSADLSVRAKALIDTCAPRTIFPRGYGEAIGIEFPSPLTPGLPSHKLLGDLWVATREFVHLVFPPFHESGWDAEVDFLLDEGLPFGVLGLDGFLNRWVVSLNAYHSYFVVEPIDDFERRMPRDPFVEFQRQFPDSYSP